MRHANGTFAPGPIGSVEARFWRFVSKAGPTLPGAESPCWVWMGGKVDPVRPYGYFWTGERQVLAHRWSFQLHHGPIPPGLLVCHRCDNPPCVNPAHLFLGTQSDNLRDMVAKGRRRSPDSPPLPTLYVPPPPIGQDRSRIAIDSPTCAKGHPWGPPVPGKHRCRTCRLAAGRAHEARRKARRLAARLSEAG